MVREIIVAPYYTGDNVLLRFEITDAEGDVNPASAEVMLIKPDSQVVGPYSAWVMGNRVGYAILSIDTDLEGNYSAYFEVILPGGLKRTHKMDFKIIKSP